VDLKKLVSSFSLSLNFLDFPGVVSLCRLTTGLTTRLAPTPIEVSLVEKVGKENKVTGVDDEGKVSRRVFRKVTRRQAVNASVDSDHHL